VEAVSEPRRRRVYTLQYPPSVNHYWRRVGGRTLISREGRRYRNRVCALLAAAGSEPLAGRLVIRVCVHPPDGRRRDLDNVQKALLDALEAGGAYRDDGQIDRIEVERGAVQAPGHVSVEISEVPA
jgi:crossover junction endodeoxyribonuclease RusA